MKAKRFSDFIMAEMSLEKGECGLAIVTVKLSDGPLYYVFTNETHKALFAGEEVWRSISGYTKPCFRYDVDFSPVVDMQRFLAILVKLFGEEIEIEEVGE